MSEKVKNCIICETPYSILNGVNYVYYNSRQDCSYDIYLGSHLKNSRETAEKLRDSGLFAHVRIFRKLRRRTYFSHKYIVDAVMDPDYCFEAYDKIYLTSATIFPACMILACRKAEIYFIDDGLGSYLDEIYVEPLSRAEKLFCIFTGRDYRRLFPRIVYLNNIRLCREDVSYEVRQLPDLGRKDSRLFEMLGHIFEYVPSGRYRDRRIIYLAQALETDLEVGDISLIERRAEAVLAMFKDDVLYRPHPRRKVQPANILWEDQKCDMWELVCMDEISDGTILVSPFSTALFTPKLIYDKEPWIIFTYKIYMECFSDGDKRLINKIETLVRCMRQMYRDPQKVICVEDNSEIRGWIRKIKGDLVSV